MAPRNAFRLVFAASLAANAALLIQLNRKPDSQLDSAGRAMASATTVVNPPAAILNWSQIESRDYLTYISRLRSIGCPEETIRDLVILDLQKVYESKVDSVASNTGSKPSQSPAELDHQFRTAVAALFGPESTTALRSIPTLSSLAVAGFHSPLGQGLAKRADGAGRGDLPSLAQAGKPPVGIADPSPSKLSGVSKENEGDGPRAASASTPQPDFAKPELKADAMDPSRIARSREYQELAAAALSRGVDAWKVDKAFAMMGEVRDQKLAILQNPNMTEEQRSAALKQAHAEARQSIDQLIGPDAFREYLSKTNRYSWLPMVPSY